MKIIRRVASWAEARVLRRVAAWAAVGERIWAAYWLVISGSLLVCASVVLRWINFPLSHNFTALQLPLISPIGLLPHRHLLSYGVLVIGVLVVGLFSRSFSRLPLALAALVLVTIFLTLPCQVAFEQPALLHRLVDEMNDVSLTRTFTKQYLPQNFGYTEDIPSHLELGTAWGRFLAALSFLGLGWACLGVGALFVTLYALTRLDKSMRVMTTICLCVPVVALAILLIRPFIGQHYFVRARVAQAQGHNEKAIDDYRHAMWWDRWFDEDIAIYGMIGDLQMQSNVAEGSVERHVKQAEVFKNAGQFEPAIFEYSQAATTGGSVAVAARREAARTRLEFGLALYRAGAVGAAVTNWRQSLMENPTQLQGLVFFARGNYDIARYDDALKATEQVIKAAGLNSVLANAYSLGGNCYTKLGQDNEARRYYEHSLKLDNDLNLWAAVGLVGN